MVRPINIFSAVAVTMSIGASAEYRIYYGLDSAFGGDQGTGFDRSLFFMPGNAEPSCGDIESDYVKRVITAGTGDLTETPGFVCEGCNDGEDKTYDFEIERLEFTDASKRPVTTEHPGVITLYPTDTDKEFDIVYFDGAGGDIVGNGGKCVQTGSDKADTFECIHWGGSWSGTHLFTCDGDVYEDED